VRRHLTLFLAVAIIVAGGFLPVRASAQEPSAPAKPPQSKTPSGKSAAPGNQTAPTPAPTENQQLQKAIDDAGNDRAALVRNLEEFLKKYPESSQRPQIYRAIVESSLQLRDFTRAMDYAERLVSLKPDDASIALLSIQLLERYGDTGGWRRAISYCTRLIDQIERTTIADKSPHVSQQDWENEKKHNRSSLLMVRGRLRQKTGDLTNAVKDYEASYALVANAPAAQHLGEIAELNKDPNTTILQYARAFALTDSASGVSSRTELRKKIGNVWRLAHGSEDGLGDYLLHTMDEVAASSAPPKAAHNDGRKEMYDFTLRKAADGTPVALADTKGKIVVLNFWATWCGPCRELEPHFEKLAAHFVGQKDVLFYALNCDEDETLVAPYLEEEKPKTTVLFADGLERLLRVNSFPTMVILDRSGKIVFHQEGFDPDSIDKVLIEAVDRAVGESSRAQAAASAH
jgi:thiol-disulfide isomerase/thioredoxin